MRRYEEPYNGGQFVLNKSTGEIHDLDNEHKQCNIDLIQPENVFNCDTYSEAWIQGLLLDNKKTNGCHYCLDSKDNG